MESELFPKKKCIARADKFYGKHVANPFWGSRAPCTLSPATLQQRTFGANVYFVDRKNWSTRAHTPAKTKNKKKHVPCEHSGIMAEEGPHEWHRNALQSCLGGGNDSRS